MPRDNWGDVDSVFPVGMELSPKERDYMARTIVAEAGGDPANQAAVAHVIRNRVQHGGFGNGVHGVITKPYAFEPWLHAGTGRNNDPLAIAADDPKYLSALQVADAVISGQLPDPTQGATHFYSPQAQRQLAAIDNRSLVPSWAKPEHLTAKIGGHEFYNLADSTPRGTTTGKKVIDVTRGPEANDWITQGWENHQNRMKGDVPPAPGWVTTGQQKFEEARPQPETSLPTTPIQPPTDWGALQSATTGLTLGAWPYIQAGIQTLDDKYTDKAPGDWKGAFEKNLANVNEQRAKYQEYSPLSHMLAEQGGALVGTALPMGLAARGVAAGGRALGGALPALRPALEVAGRLVSGETAATAPGLLAGVGRGASYAAQGATQGAGQAALTYGLQPEGSDFGEQLAWGAGGGALTGSIVNPLFSRAIAPLTAEIAPNVRTLAQGVNQKFGLNLRPTQIAKDAEINALDRRVIPQHVSDAQVMKFNDELAKQLGMGGKELTKDNVQFEMRKAGQTLSDIAATTSMRPTQNFFQDLGDIRTDLYATTLDGNPLRGKVDQILMKIYNESVHGAMDGNKFRAFTKKDGLIDKELLNSTDPSARTLGYKLKDKMFEMFEVSDPTKASAYTQARHMYKKLLAVEPLANASGVIDPTKLLKRAQKYNLKGDVQELGEAGQFMAKTTSTGAAKGATKPPTFEQIKDLGRNALPAIPSAAAYMLNAPPGAVAATAAILGGGQYLGGKARDWAMASPLIGKMVLDGVNLGKAIAPTENILARSAANMTTQVGAGSERKKRK